MSKITLIRGLPGSGKTTLAEELAAASSSEVICVSADDFFVDSDGTYRFNPYALGEAHAQCQTRACAALGEGVDVIVHNTFTQQWEMATYVAISHLAGADLAIVDLYDGGLTNKELVERQLHGVPIEALSRMRDRYERDSS